MKNYLLFLKLLIGSVVCFLFFFLSVAAYPEGTWTHIPEACGKQIGIVINLVAGKDGSIWVSSDAGILRYKNNSWIDESSHFGYASNITISPHGDVWFCGYADLLAKYDGDIWHYYQHDGPKYGMNKIGVGADGIVWCATDKGVVRFDGSIWELHTTENGLKHNGASDISVSPDGVPWICYGGAIDNSVSYGVSWFNSETWETFDSNSGLPSDGTTDVAFGPDGSVYVSYGAYYHTIHGIMHYNGTSWEQISDKICGKMIIDDKGILWAYVGSDSPGYIVTYNGTSWENHIKIENPSSGFGPRPQGVMALGADGSIWIGTSKGILVYSETMGIQDEHTQNPQEYCIMSNYPNPFNISTTISFILPEPTHVRLDVYSITGQKVASLVDSRKEAGLHSVVFDGSGFASGIYFYRFTAGVFDRKGRMVLVK